MRVSLTEKDLAQPLGKQLLNLSMQICSDGKLDLEEIKTLWRWLKQNKETTMPSITYLYDIMHRVTADKVIDRDELFELQMAIERVVPPAFRKPLSQARKDIEKKITTIRKEVEKERKRQEKLKQKADQKLAEWKERKFRSIPWKELDKTSAMPLRFTYSKVAGISFMNDDFSERQDIASKSKRGDNLDLRHTPENPYSCFAIQVLKEDTREQLGHVPEELARMLCGEMTDENYMFGLITAVTGGMPGYYFGVNFLTFIIDREVDHQEVTNYVREIYSRYRNEKRAASEGGF